MADVEATGSEVSAEFAQAKADLIAAKEAGNGALKSADMPKAMECYEEALVCFQRALVASPQEKVLRNNEVVHYGEGQFAVIDTAFPQFGDYVLEDLATSEIVLQKVGKYDEVQRRFLRKELLSVPMDLFELRVACLNNLTLVALKIAKGSQRESDFKDVVHRADAALAMDGRSAKALMRKGSALIELRQWENASKVLVAAAQETQGRDAEVMRLLEQVWVVKGKGRGKGKRRPNKDQLAEQFSHCSSCGQVGCKDPNCRERSVSESEADEPESASEDISTSSSPQGQNGTKVHFAEEPSADALPQQQPSTTLGPNSVPQHRKNGREDLREDDEVEKLTQAASPPRQSSYLVPLVVVCMIALLIAGNMFMLQRSDSDLGTDIDVEL